MGYIIPVHKLLTVLPSLRIKCKFLTKAYNTLHNRALTPLPPVLCLYHSLSLWPPFSFLNLKLRGFPQFSCWTQSRPPSLNSNLSSQGCCCLVAQSCLTLCNPMDYRLPGSSAHGVSQGRIAKWVAIPFSRGSPRPRVWTHVPCLAGTFLTAETPGKPFFSGKPSLSSLPKSVYVCSLHALSISFPALTTSSSPHTVLLPASPSSSKLQGGELLLCFVYPLCLNTGMLPGTEQAFEKYLLNIINK